jgi:hypothetical protein
MVKPVPGMNQDIIHMEADGIEAQAALRVLLLQTEHNEKASLIRVIVESVKYS